MYNSEFLFTDFHGRYIGVWVALYRVLTADASCRVAGTVVDAEVTSSNEL